MTNRFLSSVEYMTDEFIAEREEEIKADHEFSPEEYPATSLAETTRISEDDHAKAIRLVAKVRGSEECSDEEAELLLNALGPVWDVERDEFGWPPSSTIPERYITVNALSAFAFTAFIQDLRSGLTPEDDNGDED